MPFIPLILVPSVRALDTTRQDRRWSLNWMLHWHGETSWPRSLRKRSELRKESKCKGVAVDVSEIF